MRRFPCMTILALTLTGGLAWADACITVEPDQVYGYSGDEVFGGSSYLGVDTRDITPDRLGPLHLKEERGVEVTMVDQDAPAGQAGIREHDVIVTINGQQVESVEQLRRMIHEIPPGRTVSIGISRNGEPVTVKAQLADRKKTFAYVTPGEGVKTFAVPPIPSIPAIPDIDIPMSIVVVHTSQRTGLMVENLTPQLGDFFGAKNGQGVLVRSVEKGSRAEKAGFRAGDVIVKVNGQAVADTGDFTQYLRSRKENTVTVVILRDRREQTITLALPEHKQSDLFGESKDSQDEWGIETEISLGELKSELARLRPQFELAMQYARDEARHAQDAVRKSLCQQREQLRKQREEMRKQQEELRKQWQTERQRIQDEIRHGMTAI